MPDGQSNCDLCTITCDGCLGMNYTQAYDADSTGYDSPVYTRPHRDAQIVQSMQDWMLISPNSTMRKSIFDIYLDKNKARLNMKRWKKREMKILRERREQGLI